jgi:flagellum-specific ATP synthase
MTTAALRRLVVSAEGARIPAGGRVAAVRGIIIEADGLDLPIGALVEVETDAGFLPAEIVGFRGERVQLIPLSATRGIASGCRVWPSARAAEINAGEFLLGRVLGGMGDPIDGGAPFTRGVPVPLYREPLPPLDRPTLAESLDIGVRAINGVATFARGQRVGIFSGPGVGKSTLLGMMVRGTDADVRVVGLIGERGREVREFVERELGAWRSSTVVVAVPSDSSPLLRTRGAYVATAVAEYFRDRGKDVLLVMDSVTRFALAGREIGLARGEPATTKGYTPSVFAELPRLLERAGRTREGSITGIYTVLIEGGDIEDPVADSLRAILDGHIVLSRDLAQRGQYPAVDVLESISRAMQYTTGASHQALAARLRHLIAAYRDAEDLIQVGAYAAGSDAVVDEAIQRRAAIESFLKQGIDERVPLPQSVAELGAALGEAA